MWKRARCEGKCGCVGKCGLCGIVWAIRNRVGSMEEIRLCGRD